MLSPPLTGTPDAIEGSEHMARDSGEYGGTEDAVSALAQGTRSAGRSKARVLCTWKGCGHQEPDPDKMRIHAATHRRCPKENCGWAKAGDQKEKDRHVWAKHRVWAGNNMYPTISARCDVCFRTFAREDSVKRHKKEVHGVTKRVRQLGG